MENRISLLFDESEKTEIRQFIQGLNEKLLPHLVELADGESRELPNMGDKSYSFVVKALEYARQYPEFAGLIDVPEFEKDLRGYEMIREMYIPLVQLTKKLHDTMTLMGSEALVSGLTYYGTAKEARKRKSGNSILVCDELGKRFPGRTKAKTEEPE